jgi:hypothetical protein
MVRILLIIRLSVTFDVWFSIGGLSTLSLSQVTFILYCYRNPIPTTVDAADAAPQRSQKFDLKQLMAVSRLIYPVSVVLQLADTFVDGRCR